MITTSDSLYKELTDTGLEVLYDDRRDVSPGVKFKDADLLGMPFQVIVGEKNLSQGKIEIKMRKTGTRTLVERDRLVASLQELLP